MTPYGVTFTGKWHGSFSAMWRDRSGGVGRSRKGNGYRYLAGWYQSQRILPRNDRFYVYVNVPCDSCCGVVC